MIVRSKWLTAALLVLAGLSSVLNPAPADAAYQPDFSFIQVSDLHFPRSATETTLADLRNLGQVYLAPYRTTAAAPSFVIATGDLTEFGPIDNAWDAYNKAMDALGLLHYPVLGNHDTTWRSLSREVSLAQGSTFYSWNAFGCRFVVLRSAGIQDPRPLIEPQQIDWLKRDLSSVPPDTPVFVALHHPLDTKEFSSPYETDRLVEALRPYNVAALLVGHSHTITRTVFGGMDMVRGGSTWGPCVPGCVIYYVSAGRLRAAYKARGKPEATIALLDKPLHPGPKPAPLIEIVSPEESAECKDELTLRVRATGNPADVRAVRADVDGRKTIELAPDADALQDGHTELLEGRVDLSDLPSGVHYVRVTALAGSGSSFSSSRTFRIVRDRPAVRWRADLRAASRSTPAVSERAVYVGANDGWVRAYDRWSGELLWRYATGGPVTGEPLLMADKLYFGSEDTFFYCVTADAGHPVWKFPAGSSIYSSPVGDGKSVYFGCCSGALYSLDASSGSLNWVNRDATYTIESKPCLARDRIYYGAWDCYVYCVDAATGKLVWKCMGQGSAEGKAPAYYSPADCGPVVLSLPNGGKVFIADRKHRLSIIDAESGRIDRFIDSVSAVAPCADGRSVYARRLDGRLAKLNQDGDPVWTAACEMDDVPAPPREVNGVVYVSSKRGLVSAVGAADGTILWQYQATPQSYVFSAVAAVASDVEKSELVQGRGTSSGATAYISGTDGSLTAVGN